MPGYFKTIDEIDRIVSCSIVNAFDRGVSCGYRLRKNGAEKHPQR